MSNTIPAPRRATHTEAVSADIAQTRIHTLENRIDELATELRTAEKALTLKQEALDSISKELAKAHEINEELKKDNATGVIVYAYDHTSDDGEQYAVIDIDTEDGLLGDKIKVVLNDGDLFFGNPNDPTPPKQPGLFELAQHMLKTNSGGAQQILANVAAKGDIERAGYLATIQRCVQHFETSLADLKDFERRTHIAVELAR